MLNADTKRHIDAARDVLVGKVPNPISQVNEITNALVYKFMDDMDERAASMGGKRRYFTGKYEKYSWRQIMDPKIGAIQRIGLYTEALSRLSENPDLPELFRGIFRNAYLPFNDPRTLSLFLNEINYFDYQNSEQLGNAYEYLLSIMGSQGDAGQFRTPRHIIDFIVNVLDPTKDDSVLDPACGTAGFLISAYTHVMSKHDGKDDTIGVTNSVERPLTADEKRKLHNNYHGFDIDDNMVKMAQVNMYLHGFPDPKIIIHDSLSSEDYWEDRYSVIMANPPFMSPKGGIVPHGKFGVQSNRAEVLFVDYIKSHLKPNGRAGIIVPEGIIFQSGNTYKQLRKSLVEEGLYAVVSLPSGVFNPYAGVKTSILFFDNDRAKQQKEILFAKISKEGYDLGAQRRPLCSENGDKPEWCPKHSDFPEVLEVLNKWKNGEKVDSSQSVYVEKTRIAESGEYDLSSDHYRIVADYTKAKWPMAELGQVVEILDYRRKPITKSDRTSGQFPYYGATGILDYVHEYIFDERLVLIGEDGAKWGIGDKTAFIAEGKYWVNNHAHVVRPIKEKLIDTFLVSYLNSIDLTPYITGVTVPKLNQEKLRSIKITLPPLEIQEQIVAELDGYAAIISGAKKIVQNWKPKIDIDPEWPLVRLGDESKVISGYSFDSKDFSSVNTVRSIKITNVGVNDFVYDDSSRLPTAFLKRFSGFTANTDDIVISLTRSIISSGLKVALVPKEWDNSLVNQRVAVIKQRKKMDIHFLYTYLSSDTAFNYVRDKSKSLMQPNLSVNALKAFLVPLPPYEIQKQIVGKIEVEHVLVESAKKLIEIYEQKTKDTVDKLWHD